MNQVLVILTLLASVGFYNYHNMFSIPQTKLMLTIFIVASMVMGLTEKNSSLKDVYYPRVLYVIVLATILFSALMADVFHGQPFDISIKAALQFFLPYLYFYILMRQRVAPSKIIRFLIIYIFCSGIIYYFNFRSFPHNIFGEPIEEDLTRGIIRIPVVGLEVVVLLLFYSIGRWNDFRQKKWWLVIVFAVVMIILSVIRQVIGLALVLGLIMFLRHHTLFSKVLIAAVVAIIALLLVPRLPMYKSIVELSEMQADRHKNDNENVRALGWKYYTYESWDNPAEMIFGHGVYSTAGDSEWGSRMDAETDISKLYLYDIGWAGFIYYFGLLGAGALLALFIVTVRHCARRRSKEYLAYWFVYLTLTSIASAPILYFHQILIVSLCLYLAYCPEDDMHYDSENYYDPSRVLLS